jgi:hypothetical protein
MNEDSREYGKIIADLRCTPRVFLEGVKKPMKNPFSEKLVFWI